MCGVAQMVGKCIALIFHDSGTKRLSGQQHAPAALYYRERSSTHFKGGGGPLSLPRWTENLVPSGIRPRTVQALVSRYTN